MCDIETTSLIDRSSKVQKTNRAHFSDKRTDKSDSAKAKDKGKSRFAEFDKLLVNAKNM